MPQIGPNGPCSAVWSSLTVSLKCSEAFPREVGAVVEIYVQAVSWMRSKLPSSDRGASLVEYALLVALIALVCFIAVDFVGTEANSEYDGVGSSIRG